ncbi:silicon efflux transporter LSI3 [Selaginella moellendorffii]|uniref:silicon efflux transporter LSI3 n=1 Tax=Selaginella moellendorffii TaxID=88036 RepID=UPI000D1C6938|nr:silicon efflux transporter LSI3 [Selaginella moellendorffii]|eukprot:XP_024545144.1 silicon efflux transporter LSI3 [Selaginella moellendorffii]
MAWASTPKVVLGCFAFGVFWIMAVVPVVPFLPIGRTAGSLLGACLMVVFQVLSPAEAFAAVDLPILGLLFGTMVVSVYLERADAFKYLGHALSWRSLGGKDLLCRLCLLSALCSALFTNDTTCVVLTQFVLEVCREKKLPPQPFLIALASSANIGSAATPIGNPQNLVIAVESKIAFGKFLGGVVPAMVLGLIANTLLLLAYYWKKLRGVDEDAESSDISIKLEQQRPEMELLNSGLSFTQEQRIQQQDHRQEPKQQDSSYQTPDLEGQAADTPDLGKSVAASTSTPDGQLTQEAGAPPLPRSISSSRHLQRPSLIAINEILRLEPRGSGHFQASLTRFQRLRKKVWKVSVYLVTIGMLVAFLYGLDLSWTAITAAIVLMVLDFTDASPSLDQVSYSLLVFFSGMFIAVRGFNRTGAPGQLWDAVEPHARINTAAGIAILSAVVILLSNVASNVPTVLLLGARVAASAAATEGASVKKAWLILAWVSTVAGNLTLVGSAANIIVSEQASRMEEHPYNLSFWNHLRFGAPATFIVIAVGLPLIQG